MVARSLSSRSSQGWMSLLQRFFERAVVLRGEQYTSRVRVVTENANRVVAKVSGSSLYTVVLAKEGSALKVWCTCPYCEGELSLCKHVWATLRKTAAGVLFAVSPKPESLALEPELSMAHGPARGVGGRHALVLQAEEEDDFSEDSGGLDEADYFEDAGDEDDGDPEEDDSVDDVVDTGRGTSAELADFARWPPPSGAAGSASSSTGFAFPGAELAPVSWKQLLASSRMQHEASMRERPATTQLRYLVLPSELRQARSAIYLVEAARDQDVEGALVCVPATERVRRLGRDAHAVEYWLAGQRDFYGSPRQTAEPHWNVLPEVLCELAGTGRLHVAERRQHGLRDVVFDAAVDPLHWEDEPFRLELAIGRASSQTSSSKVEYRVEGGLARGAERRALHEASVLTATGLVVLGNLAAPFDPAGMFGIVAALRGSRAQPIRGEEELEAFVRDYHLTPSPPPLTLPDGKRLAEVAIPLQPVLDLRRPESASKVSANAWFEYGDWRAAAAAPGDRVLDWQERRVLMRDLETERARLEELSELGFRGPVLRKQRHESDAGSPITLNAKKLPAAVVALLDRGWRVEAEGKPYRAAGAFKATIKSGIDWFELDASLAFETEVARLPALLRALKKGERTVVLDDGSVGLLPEEWLSRWGVLGDFAAGAGENLRFARSEQALLAAICGNAPEVDYDAAFGRLLRELEQAGRPRPIDPPAGFAGELRSYQREGLGWLAWLERTGLGGCLADDMGLGKTVQILALLSRKRTGKRPSLVVAPRSVLFNWMKETARFAPALRVCTHWGAERRPAEDGFDGYDVVLTTYGTLCRDIVDIAKQSFRFVVLDEAQAVKNPESRTARSVRLLRAEQRLALTGTPIENHLGELFSLFEFLNPGMLARAKRLRRALTKPQLLDTSQAALLSRAVRPFILRRTKAQVARDLPERTEQTLYVELSSDERAKYDELLAFYRVSLAKKVEDVGMERSTPHVLAALLRLRQAACHVGLLDEKRIDDGSAKLEVLLAQIEQVLDGGHKALVFSQFTSLLGILRSTLEERGIAYEYLDGKTRDRAACVERFQSEDRCRLFLVSLKAGGVGLNLTAADYVFILDPWWNPAVEAQAIDRAHRIGQTKRVVAYRLLARNTVEEKVELLKERKRDLVRTVLGGDAGFGGKLTREDLELLMS